MVGVALAPEIVIDVLLAGEPGAPRRDTAGAIVEHAQHAAAGRIGLGLQSLVAGGGARDLHRRFGVDPPCVFRACDHAPLVALADNLDDRSANRRHFDGDQLRCHLGEEHVADVLPADAGEHQLLIGIFVVRDQEAMAGGIDGARHREIGEVVVVVTELALLRGCGLRIRVVGGCARQHRIAPADEHVGIISRGDVMVGIGARFELRKWEA